MTASGIRRRIPKTEPRAALRALALALALAGSAALRADIIVLKNGNQLQGEVVENNGKKLTVRFPNGVLHIPTRDIERVESEDHLEYLLAEGERHLRRSDFERAISYYEEAVEQSGGDRRARSGLLEAHERHAQSLREEHRLRQAAAAYRRLLSLRPEDLGASRALEEVHNEVAELARAITAGRRLLDGGRVQEARASLRKIYDTYPDQRAELNGALGLAAMRLGHAACSKGDPEAAERYYREALGFDPDLLGQIESSYATIKIRQLQELVEGGDLEGTLRASEEAREILPANLFVEYYRGLGLQGTGKLEEAAEVFLELSGLKRPRDPVKSIDDLRRASQARLSALDREKHGLSRIAVEEVLPGDWRELVTEHFVVHHHNNAVAREVAAVAEQTYLRLFAELDSRTHWYKRCQIYLYPDAEAFRKATGLHNWTGGAHQIVRRRGTLAEHRISSYQGHPRLFQAIIPHEVAHAMLEHYLRYRGEVPRWIGEGFAMRMEPAAIRSFYERIISQSVKVGRHIRMGEFLHMKDYPESEDALRIYYSQAYSVWSFLERKKGLKHLLQFTEKLALSPDSLDELLKRYYGIAGPIALENLWRGYLDLEL